MRTLRQPSVVSRRHFLRTAALTGAGAILADRAPAIVGKATRRMPNIIYVFADQLRADVVGCHGGRQIATPNMDRIAAEGCRMENCISTWPVCTPYRGMMLTGRFPMRNGAVSNTTPLLDGLPTVGTMCRAAGYATGYIGKWHLESHREAFVPLERRQGFDYWAVRNCSHQYYDSFYCAETATPIPLPGWEPDGQTRLAVDFIRRNRDNPFCLMLSWGPPHDPYVAPPEYLERLARSELEFRGNVAERGQVDALLAAAGDVEPNILKFRKRDRSVIDDDKGLKGWLHAYLSMTSSLDDCLGRLMRELERLNLVDDTLIVFTSDHGDMLGSHRMGSKRMPHEESIRVPFLVRYPRGIPPGTVSSALFAPIDVLPTLAGLAGLEKARGVDGLDISASIRGERHDQRDALLLMKMMPGGTPWFVNGVREWRGVRTKRHTYARLLSSGPWLLFDNEADPLQMENLVARESSAGLVREMENRLSALMKDAGDPGETEPIRRFVQENKRTSRSVKSGAGPSEDDYDRS